MALDWNVRSQGTIATAVVAGLCVASGCSNDAKLPDAPVTARRAVNDVYHGVTVTDDYRWLEDSNNAEVKTWSDAQNTHARAILDALPSATAIRARITALHQTGVTYARLRSCGTGWVALRLDPRKDQPSIVFFANPDDPASGHTVVDPVVLDPKGTTSMDWFQPSPDGRLLAVSLSEGGSERGNVHIFETATGRDTGDTIPRVNDGTAGGSLSWAADGSGVYYTRYPRSGERPVADLDFYTQVYFHALGTDVATDRYEIGKDFPPIAEIFLRTSPDGRFVLANVANGDGGEYVQFVRMPDGRWSQLSQYEDKVVLATFGDDQALYLLSRRGAPHGRVLRVALGKQPPRLTAATLVVPEANDAVVAFDPTGADTVVASGGRLYIVDIVGGPNQVRVYSRDGRPLGSLPVPGVVTIPELVVGSSRLLVSAVGFKEPQMWYELPAAAVDPSRATISKKDALSAVPGDAFANVDVERTNARSTDGSEIPLTIAHRTGIKLDGRNPTLLIGYGGYGISYGPFFMAGFGAWFEQGGVVVVANIRGGGELGEAWHLAGNLTRKQTVFDDFIASAEHLVQTRYTSPGRLAILGGSNGGLLMGAALTQRPDLFKAVVSYVGIYDMLRVELSPNGSFNVTEFGTVKDPDQFRAMHAYSPYHHVKDGAAYPPMLMLTGANDPRVDPMQSRKMTARLQAASPKSRVLLRTSASAGHGFGTALSEIIEQDVDVYAFLFDTLGLEYKAHGASTKQDE